ncbi:N-terminal kinase-like protein [Conglomerata obtusa]
MNFFKNILPTSVSKTLVTSTRNYDLYKTTENTATISQFKYKDYKSGLQAITILKTLKHSNIINVVKVKTEKSNTYIKTEYMISLGNFYNESLDFNFSAIGVVANVLVFLRRCAICHNNLSFETLYVNEGGKVILGDFEYAKKDNSSNDNFLLSTMIEKLKKDASNNLFIKKVKKIKIHPMISKDKINFQAIENKNGDNNSDIIREKLKIYYLGCDDFINYNREFLEKSIYTIFQNNVMKYKILTLAEKSLFLDLILRQKSNLIEIQKIKIVNLLFLDIFTEDQEFRGKLLYLILFLNLKNYDKEIEFLFSINDKQIRCFIVSNANLYIPKVSNWNDKLFQYIITDIKGEDTSCKIECIKLIDKISKFLNNKNLQEVIKLLYSFVKDDKGITEALFFIRNNFERIKTDKSLLDENYKLIVVYLSYDSTRNQTLTILHMFYTYLDFKKLQLEIIPMLCSLLSDANNQDLCFDLILEIIGFLKANKSKLIVENWSVKKLSKVFDKVSFKLPVFMSKKSEKNSLQKSTNDVRNNDNKDENEWDDEW